MLSERFTTKGYECTKCQAIHFEFEALYLNHLRLQSKNGVASYAPSAVAMVVDDRNAPQAPRGPHRCLGHVRRRDPQRHVRYPERPVPRVRRSKRGGL